MAPRILQLNAPQRFYPEYGAAGTHLARDWVTPRAGLDVLETGKNIFPCREMKDVM